MTLAKLSRTVLFLGGLLVLIAAPNHARSQGKKDLIASLAAIPGLADSPEKGAFVDLAKAMAEVYTEGKIKIEVYPWARSIDNVVSGKADFHIPNMRIPTIDESKLSYKFADKAFGNVYFVIYSNTAKKLTKKMLDDAAAKLKADGTPFPYKIEAAGGLQSNFPFPTVGSNDYATSFKKLALGRIDGILGAQEDADVFLKQLKLKNIQRIEWNHYPDVITVAKGARGDQVDKIVSELLTRLEKSGRLNELYSRIHIPYNDWQPASMGW